MRWEERGRGSPVENQHLPLREDHSARVGFYVRAHACVRV